MHLSFEQCMSDLQDFKNTGKWDWADCFRWLRTPVGLSGDPGSFSSTPMVNEQPTVNSSSEILCPLLALTGTACMWCISTQCRKHKIKKNIFLTTGKEEADALSQS